MIGCLNSMSVQSSQNWLLELARAVELAQEYDPWLRGNSHAQKALESSALAANELPDPALSVSFSNLPVDSFSLHHEPMTQLELSYSQKFPRGNSRAVRSKQLKWKASQHPFERLDRKAQIAVTVSDLWFDGFLAQASIALINRDRYLFEQLIDIAQASYSSSIAKVQQQDIVRAQLELSRLEDRLTILGQQRDVSLQSLSGWLRPYGKPGTIDSSLDFNALTLPETQPQVEWKYPEYSGSEISDQELVGRFQYHPSIKALDNKIRASRSGIDLAREMYKPAFSVNASYGYRDSDQRGLNRSDLFSIGVNLDLPIFQSRRQDKNLQKAISEAEAVKTEKWQRLKKMMVAFRAYRARLTKLNQRSELYQERLLPQMNEQSAASLSAYTNDRGDFSDVVRARIDELNAEIDALGILVDRQKVMVHLNYLLLITEEKAEINLLSGEGE